MYNHYIKLQDNKMIRGFSDAFEQPEKDDILIAENAGRHFELDGAINPPLADEQGVALYKYEKGKVIKRTPAEIDADIALIPEPEPEPPSEFEILKKALIDKAVLTEKDLTDTETSLKDVQR